MESTEDYSAVYPTNPKSSYPNVAPVAEYSPEIGVIADSSLFGTIMTPEKTEEEADCCPIPVVLTTRESKCC